MIKEDYVSFETAKLLKEKDFNESCYTYYDDIGDSINRFHKGYHFNNTSYPWGVPYDLREAKKYVVSPTLQMAMKWLREVHNIAINIGWGEIFVEDYRWWCIILNQKSDEILRDSEYYKTYEEACESAIKYCLENLI